MIGTYRHTDVGPEDPLAQVLADLRREPAVDRVALRGLDEDDVAAFVRDVQSAPAEKDAALARALHSHTSGNPFFVGELLRHLRESVLPTAGTAPGATTTTPRTSGSPRASVVSSPDGCTGCPRRLRRRSSGRRSLAPSST